mgnify:CR=1 FL=1
MSQIVVTVQFDKIKLLKSMDDSMDEGLQEVGTEALKDANFYARQLSGETIRSSIQGSNFKEATLEWRTPYVRRIYYTGQPSKSVNPNASLLWAHRSYAENAEKYRAIMRKVAARNRG